MLQRLAIATFSALALHMLMFVGKSDGCNEAVCGSVVSKCLLTQSCKCDLKNCTCYKECSNCLSFLYSECCSCVDLCPKLNDTGSALDKKSYVEDLPEKAPALFNALTDGEDPDGRWITVTYPIDFDNLIFGGKKNIKFLLQSVEQEVVPTKPNVTTLNCTVAFITQCMSFMKCKSNCISMGASSYRWFHDGCCECIGEPCLNYGINESRCKCSLYDNMSEEEFDDYGDAEAFGDVDEEDDV